MLYALEQGQSEIGLISEEACHHPRLAKLKQMAIEIVAKRTATTPYWGFKDPRTAKILFWEAVFKECQLNEHYLIALRNPLASALSYQRVMGTDIELGLLLWIVHLLASIDGTMGKHRMMVSYEAMLQNPLQQLDRIKSGLAIPSLVDTKEREDYAHTFLDKKLQHFVYDREQLINHPAVAALPLCINMYDLFVKVANDDLSLDSEAFAVEWAAIKTEFKQSYPVYQYFDRLLNKNKQLERTLRTIYKSIPWKLLYPLRLIDDALRARRKKVREKQRLVTVRG